MVKNRIHTMAELSQVIGVSRPTLSRYFQDPATVRRSTREKISRGLDQVDYVPNFFAMRMNRKSTGLVGVIVPHLSDLFFTGLLDAIDLAAIERGFTIITLSSHGDPEVESAAISKLLSMSADGAIVAPLGARSDGAALDRLAASLPLVFLDSRATTAGAGIDFVGTDNRQSIGLVTEYLCRTGPPPVFLAMPPVNSNAPEREAAYRERMESLGHRPVVLCPPDTAGDWDFESLSCALLGERFGQGRLTGATILAANDRLAIGAIRAANRHGLLPREPGAASWLRIAGHDDHPLSRFMSPSLTTVAQNVTAIGREAVAILSRRLRGTGDGAPARVVFDATLKLRESA